jgi:hypothetical protein
LSNKFQLNENLLYRAGLGYLAAMTVVLDHSSPVPPHVQKDSIISLDGVQVDYLLSQKISDNLVLHNQKIDPITSVGYIFSAGMQIGYKLYDRFR